MTGLARPLLRQAVVLRVLVLLVLVLILVPGLKISFRIYSEGSGTLIRLDFGKRCL